MVAVTRMLSALLGMAAREHPKRLVIVALLLDEHHTILVAQDGDDAPSVFIDIGLTHNSRRGVINHAPTNRDLRNC